MNTDTVVQARVDADTKIRAVAALDEMGLSVSAAIRLFLQRVADERRLPFADKVPNADTMEAMEELKTGRCKRYDSMEELYRELDI